LRLPIAAKNLSIDSGKLTSWSMRTICGVAAPKFLLVTDFDIVGLNQTIGIFTFYQDVVAVFGRRKHYKIGVLLGVTGSWFLAQGFVNGDLVESFHLVW
jgi:hypothetical protein